MNYLSDEFMLDLLAKVQPFQAEILKTGHSAHIDAGVHNNLWDANHGSHINFSVDIFYENSIIESFDFSSADSADELNAEFMRLQAFIKNRL